MKNTFKFMFAVAVLGAATSQADLVLTETFSETTFAYTHKNAGALGTDYSAGEWFTGANGTEISSTASNPKLVLGWEDTSNKLRAAGVWLDASTWGDSGTVSITFKASAFSLDDGTTAYLELFSGTTGSTLDMQGGPTSGIVATDAASLVSWDVVNGTQTVTFDFDSSMEYMALAFAYTIPNLTDATASAAFSVDTIRVDVVPEPATIGMLGLGALVALFVRKLRG